MSKPIARVVFSVLIALVLVAGIYSSVQGAMLHGGTKNGQAYVNIGLILDQGHYRTLSYRPDGLADPYGRREHGCHAESNNSLDD